MEFKNNIEKLFNCFLEQQLTSFNDKILIDLEKKIGKKIPEVLKVFYKNAHHFPQIMNSYHRFLMINELNIKKKGLIFCYENQNQMYWAILDRDLEKKDPPVYQGQEEDSIWHVECNNLSTFLLNISSWQLINSLEYNGYLDIKSGIMKKLKDNMNIISATLDFGMASLVDYEKQLIACALLDAQKIYIASKKKENLEFFEKTTGIELDWV